MTDEIKEKICKNDSFKKLVIKYQETENPDYAMLLDAPWGAGKSYYIKKFIDELSKNYTDYTFIYFSLNGINDIKSTASNLFCNLLLRYDKNSNVYKIFKELDKTKSSLIDFVNDPKTKNILNTCSSISSDIFSFIMNLSLKKQERIKKSILFLDDLERVSDKIDITDLLGTLNNCFILNNIKIVYIANEVELLDRDNYKAEKEKYIRRTYKYIPDKNKVFKSIIKSIPLLDGIPDLLDPLNNAFFEVQPNLRTVKTACDYLSEMIFMYNEFSNKEDYYSPVECFYSLCAYTKLYSDGKTCKEELQGAINLYPSLSLYDEKEELNDYQKFLKDYSTGNYRLLKLESVINLVFDGLLDKNTLLHDLLIPLNKEDPLYYITRNAQKLESDVLIIKLKEVVNNLKQLSYNIRDLDSLKSYFIPYIKSFPIITEKEANKLIIDSIFDKKNKDVLFENFDFYKISGTNNLPTFTSNFDKKLKNEYSKYLKISDKDLIQQAIEAIKGCSYNDNFFVNRNHCTLFSLFYNNNQISYFLTLSNNELFFISSILNTTIICCTNAYDVYKSEEIPLQELNTLIDNKLQDLEKKEFFVEGYKDVCKIKAFQTLKSQITLSLQQIATRPRY